MEAEQAFRQAMIKLGSGIRKSVIFCVRREHVLSDTFFNLQRIDADQLARAALDVRFRDQESSCATEEWHTQLVDSLFEPSHALFNSSATPYGRVYFPNAASAVNSDHLRYFAFAGRLIGKALLDGRSIGVHLAKPMYKHILDMPCTLDDLVDVDRVTLASLQDLDKVDLGMRPRMTFVYETSTFGKSHSIDLIPGGRNIQVTNSNKAEFKHRMTQHILTEAVNPQVEALRSGLFSLVPPDVIDLLSLEELDRLCSGD